MKDLFSILRQNGRAVRPGGTTVLAATRRELSALAHDLSNLYGRNWSDHTRM